MLQLREVAGWVVAEATLPAPRLAPLLQLRSQGLPVIHVAGPQLQTLVRPQPRRQAGITRAEPITTKPGDA